MWIEWTFNLIFLYVAALSIKCTSLFQIWLAQVNMDVSWLFSAVGCPTFVPPQNSTARLDDEGYTVVTCNFTGEESYLTCRDHKWTGIIANCTKGKVILKPQKLRCWRRLGNISISVLNICTIFIPYSIEYIL